MAGHRRVSSVSVSLPKHGLVDALRSGCYNLCLHASHETIETREVRAGVAEAER
jgi:hypothetical protein